MPDDLIGNWLASQKKLPSITSQKAAIEQGANDIGIDPVDYATAMSYETGGRFGPWEKGPVTKWGQHRGTIQYGEPQQRQYGVTPDQSFESQVTTSNVKYLKDRGVKPGMTFPQIYAAINGGNVNRNLNTPDVGTGRTIGDNIRNAQRDHRQKVVDKFGFDTGDKLADFQGQSQGPDLIEQFLGSQQPAIVPGQTPAAPVQDVASPVLSPTQPAAPIGTTPSAPVPESPQTLEAQVVATRDQSSTKAAVLLTPQEAKLQDPASLAGLLRRPMPDGRILYVNGQKAKAMGVTNYVRDMPKLLGKVTPVADTSQGTAVVSTLQNGKEANTSVVSPPTPGNIQDQAAVDQSQFPGQIAKQEVMPTQDAAAKRLEITDQGWQNVRADIKAKARPGETPADTLLRLSHHLEFDTKDHGKLTQAQDQQGLPPGVVRLTDQNDQTFLAKQGKTPDSYDIKSEADVLKGEQIKRINRPSGVPGAALGKTFDPAQGLTIPAAMGQPETHLAFDKTKQQGLRPGEYRFEDEDGTPFIYNPTSGAIADETGTQVIKDIQLPLPDPGSVALPVARTAVAGMIADSIAEDHPEIPKQDVIDYFDQYGFTDWETKAQAAPEKFFKSLTPDPLTGLTKDTDTFHLTQLDLNRVKAYSEQRQNTRAVLDDRKAQYMSAGQDDYTADVHARQDVGWMTQQEADDEIAAYEQKRQETSKRIQAQFDSPTVRTIMGSRLSSELDEGLNKLADQSLGELRQKYGGDQPFKTAADEDQRVANLPWERKLKETGWTALRSLSNAGASVMKMAAAGEFAINNAFTDIPSQKYRRIEDTNFATLGDAYQWFSDSVLPSDPQARQHWLPKATDALMQVAIMAAVTKGVGGSILPASILGLSQGAAQQMDEARKEGATPNQQLAMGVVGAVAAMPDILLMKGWFKHLGAGEQTGLVRMIGQNIFKRVVGEVGEVEAEALAKQGVKAFLDRAKQLGKKILFNTEEESFHALTPQNVAKTLVTEGLYKEGVQEVSENKFDAIGKKFIYKPKLDWKDILTINDEDVDSYIYGAVGGMGGGGIEIATHPDAFKTIKDRRAASVLINQSLSENNITYKDGKKSFTIGGKNFEVTPEIEALLKQYNDHGADIRSAAEDLRGLPKRVKKAEGFTEKKEIIRDARATRDRTETLSEDRNKLASQIIEKAGAGDALADAVNNKGKLTVKVPGAELTTQGERAVGSLWAKGLEVPAPEAPTLAPPKQKGEPATTGTSTPVETATTEAAPAETAATLPTIAPVRARGFGAKTAATEAATTETTTPAATTPEHFMTPSEIDDLMKTNELKSVPPEQLPNRAEFPNSLGIPRSEMPQIRGRDQEEFIAFAKEKGIEIKPDTVKASDLKPTQSEYNPQQAMQIPPEMIAAKRLMVSSDNRVLDGHNTLVNIQQNTPNADVEIQRIPLTAKEALKLMHSFPKTTTKSVGQVGSTDEVEGKTLKSVPVEHIGSRDEITKDSIPENTWGLFNKKAFDADPKTHEMVPLSKLKSDVNLDTDQQFVDHGEGKHPLVRAFNHMANAANEKTFERKRDPIKVTENKDGSYTVEDGHATLELAKKLGWKELPVEVVNRPTTPIKLDLPKPTKNEDGADVIKKPANLPASIEWAGVSHGTGWLDLAPRLAEMQAETLSQVMADPRKWLDAAYEKVGRKVIDADEYRSLFSEYTEDKLANAQGVHEAVSLLTKMAEAERLNELEEAWKAADPATRKTPVVLMLAGGPAAGKGSSAHQEIENADLVLDRVSSNAKKAIATLENIKSKGLNPQFILVVRDFTAQAEGNVQRQPDAGRLTPAHVAAEGTLGAMDAAANQGLWDWVEKNVDEDRRAILYNYPGKEKTDPPKVIDIEDVKKMLYNKDAGRDYSVDDLRTLWKDVSHAYYEAHKTDVYQEDDAKTGKQKGQYIYDARIPQAIDGKDVATVGSAEHLRLEGDRVPDGSDRTGRAAGVHENTAGVQGVEQGGRPETPGPGNESDEQGSRERAKVHRVAGSEEEIQAKAGAGKQAEQGVPPPKDKPIVLILGGSLNPMHTGHADAAENARKALEDQGYTVEKIVVSPSPQTLLEKKNAGKESNAAPLATRAAIAEATVKGRKGFEVVQGPSIEAEQTTGKLKRTQLADWVASDNPGKTVINIAGEDAGVPGAPETLTEPTVYTGDPGTSHDGYYYLGMPRNMEEGMSSSKIRAEMKEGRSAPEGSMTPASEEIYQQHLEGTPLKKATEAAQPQLSVEEKKLLAKEKRLKEQEAREQAEEEHKAVKISEKDQKTLAKLGFNIVRGRISGAPYSITSAKDVLKQVDRAVRDARSDRVRPEDKVWYTHAGSALREYAHGDKELLEKMVRLTAVLSQTSGVQHNSNWVIKAFDQMAHGEIPHIGRFPNVFQQRIGAMLEAADFDTNLKGVDTKLQNFYRNLHDEAFQESRWPNAAVIDRHAIAYIWNDAQKDTVPANQYGYAERVMQLAADRYNKQTGEEITAKQMQSMLWGIWKRESARSASQKAQQGAAWNYPEFWKQSTANLTAEVMPSTRTPEGQALNNLSYEDKLRYQTEALRAAIGEGGQNDLLKAAGVALYKQGTGSGGYEGMASPNTIVGSLVPKRTKPEDIEAGKGELYNYESVDKAARGWQYIFKQDGVPWFRADETLDAARLDKLRATREKTAKKKGLEPKPTTMVSLGFFLDFGEPISRQQEAEFFTNLRQELGPDAGYTNMGDGRVSVVNYRGEDGNPFGLPDQDFDEAVNRVFESSGARELIHYGAETRYHFHDWEADPEGSQITREAADQGGSDWETFLRDRRDAVDAVTNKWVAKAQGQETEETAPLKKAATQESRDLITRLQTPEATEEVLAGITGGTVHANGEVELAVHDAEAIRRLMAEREYQKTGKEIDELPFDGMVLSPAQLNGLSKFGKGLGRQQAIDAGYTDEQLKGYDKLMETLGTIGKANKGHTVAFVFDTALAHERVHKEDLDAGRVTAAGRKELKKNPAWDTKGTAFEKSYPGISEADKASELAAMIASGEAAQYGLKGTAEDHQNYLQTWAKDIAENNKDNIARMGAEAWAKAFPTISALAGIQTNESSTTEQGTTEVAQEEAGTGAAPGEGSKTGGKTTAKPAAKTTTAAKTVQPTDRERTDSDLFEKVKADLEKNGVSLTDEQSTEIRQQIDATSKAKEAIGDDWTASNAPAVIDYFVKRKELEDHIAKLSPAKAIDVFLDVGARGSMLFAMRSLVNNIGYQGIPAVMQTVIKRLAGGTQIPGDYKWYEKIGAAIAGRWAPGRGAKAMGAHVAMAMKIYAKTGYDISRMESLDDGFKYFGEKHTHTEGPSFTESEGIKEKLNSLVRTHAKLMTPGMKWFAGGTDTLLANIHRADTSTMLAKTIATAERKAGTLKGTVADRVDFLFKDSMNPEPTTTEGAYIRESGIKDANHANFTNANILGDALTKMRKAIPGRIGKVIYPFVKIPATATSAGLEMATGAGLVRGIGQMIKGLKMESGNEKNTQIAGGIRTLLFSGGGLAIAALFCAGLLDDDDYIGAYDMDRRNKNGLSTIEGAGADMVRIGGNWYGTKWFGPIGIPLSAIMTARQGYAKGGAGTAALGYLRGVLTGALQFPGIKETSDWLTAFGRAAQAKDLAGMAKPMKATPADIGKWIASRTLTSTGVQDVYGSFIAPAIGAKLPKYDALGREAPTSPLHSFFFGAGIKPDTSNEITRELNKLYKADQMPTIGDPDSKNAKKLKESMGDAKFNEFLAGLKQKFGEELGKQVESSGWMKVPPEQKKKIINSMRKAIIMAPIAAKARQPVEEPDQPTKEEERP